MNDGGIPQTHGHMVHGLFFNILKQTNPELCKVLHSMNCTLPFTLSTLYKCGAHPGIMTSAVEKGKRVCFRTGLFNDELISAVSLAMNKAMITRPISIADISMSIKAIKLLDTEDIADLEQRAAKSADRLRTFRIDFQTLTASGQKGEACFSRSPALSYQACTVPGKLPVDIMFQVRHLGRSWKMFFPRGMICIRECLIWGNTS